MINNICNIILTMILKANCVKMVGQQGKKNTCALPGAVVDVLNFRFPSQCTFLRGFVYMIAQRGHS